MFTCATLHASTVPLRVIGQNTLFFLTIEYQRHLGFHYHEADTIQSVMGCMSVK